jgi:hypothetical protein
LLNTGILHNRKPVYKEQEAPTPELNPEEKVEQLLLEHGQNAPLRLVRDMTALIHAESFRAGGEMLHQLIDKIPETTVAGIALRRLLLGDVAETTREAATRCGVSHAAIVQAERRLRQSLGLP